MNGYTMQSQRGVCVTGLRSDCVMCAARFWLVSSHISWCAEGWGLAPRFLYSSFTVSENGMASAIACGSDPCYDRL